MALLNATTSRGESRRTIDRYSSALATTPTAMTAAQQMPVLPLPSFYNAGGQMVWPADAPTAGELKEKRTIFDQASQEVVTELKKNGVASIAAVTDARQKLLDYGRPGLKYVRTHETVRVAARFISSCCRRTSRWHRRSIRRRRPAPHLTRRLPHPESLQALVLDSDRIA